MTGKTEDPRGTQDAGQPMRKDNPRIAEIEKQIADLTEELRGLVKANTEELLNAWELIRDDGGQSAFENDAPSNWLSLVLDCREIENEDEKEGETDAN